MKFFEILSQQKIFDDYADVLDWILSDNKFPKEVWDNKNKVQAFTKGINRLSGFTKSTIHYDAQKVHIKIIQFQQFIWLKKILKQEILLGTLEMVLLMGI